MQQCEGECCFLCGVNSSKNLVWGRGSAEILFNLPWVYQLLFLDCFSVAKTITDGINILKKPWNIWNPWREGSGNFLHPWHWTPDFQQKLIVRIWFGGCFFFNIYFVGFFFFYFPLKELPISWDWTLTLSVCPQQGLKMNDEQGGRGRCSVVTLSMLVPMRNCLSKRIGMHFCWAWIIVS